MASTPAEVSVGPRRWLPGSKFDRIDVRPVSGALGAEIYGVDLNDWDAEVFAEIHQAFLEYHVYFLSRATALDRKSQGVWKTIRDIEHPSAVRAVGG